MSDLNCGGKWGRLRLMLLSGFVAFFLILPTTATAGGSAVLVAPPNGVDDTANIQAALDACVVRGPACTVQLRGGKYLTNNLSFTTFAAPSKGWVWIARPSKPYPT